MPDAFAFLPLEDRVLRAVGKQQVLAFEDPDGAFGPVETLG